MAGLKKARRAAANQAKQKTPQQYQNKVMTPSVPPAVSPYVMTTGDKSKS